MPRARSVFRLCGLRRRFGPPVRLEVEETIDEHMLDLLRVPRADVAVTYFGMEHPVVGGTTPDKVALRRAISLAVDLDKEIRLVRKGQAIPGHPGCP